MKQSGFFYAGRYFLLPSDCADFDTFRQTHLNEQPFPVTELLEKKCLAPYFVLEHAKQKTIRLKHTAEVFPCEVETMSMQEYNLRLRRVIPEHCKDCPNFGGIDETDASLDGHHEEITLNNICFIRPQAETDANCYLPVNAWIKNFVSAFPHLGLKEKIDSGNLKDAEQVFADALAEYAFDCIPPLWLSRSDTGKYRLICTTYTNTADRLMIEYLCDELKKSHQKDWNFFHYIPQGVWVPEAKEPLGFRYEQLENIHPSAVLTVFCEPESESAAYLWLAGLCGEDLLLNAFQTIRIETVPPSGELLPPQELPKIVEKLCKKIPKRKRLVPAVNILFCCPEPPEGTAPENEEAFFYANGRFCSTRCFEYQWRFVEPIQDGKKPENIRDNGLTVGLHFLPIAQISFSPLPISSLNQLGNSPEYERLIKRVSGLFEFLSKKGVVKVFSQSFDTKSFDVFLLVTNLTEFLYSLHRFAPLFAECPAELFLYTDTGTDGGHYRLNFDMELLETEESLFSRLQ